MRRLTINGKQVELTEANVRALQLLKRQGFVALKQDFWEGRQVHMNCMIPPNVYYYASQLRAMGVSYVPRPRPNHSGRPSARVTRFFRSHPRATQAIVGDKRRINSLLTRCDNATRET